MKLTASMMVTLDGVYQGPGGPDETAAAGSTAAVGPPLLATRRVGPS
jgi:hypothetical protein